MPEIKHDASLIDVDEGDKEVGGDTEETAEQGKVDEKGTDQHSVTFAEGIDVLKKNNNSNLLGNSDSANQRLNEYTFSPEALHAAIAKDGQPDNHENAHSVTDKMYVYL